MTFGMSPAVNSCSDPFVSAICWPRTLNSRLKSVAHRIEFSLLLLAHAKHLPQPRLQDYVCRALAASVQPVFKILNFDDMRNFGMPDFNGDARQALSDLADATVTAQRCKGLRGGFVQGL